MRTFRGLHKTHRDMLKSSHRSVLPFVFGSNNLSIITNKWDNEITIRRHYHVTAPNNSLVMIGTGMLVTAALVHIGLGLKNNVSIPSDDKKTTDVAKTEDTSNNASKVNVSDSTNTANASSSNANSSNTEKPKANTANPSKGETKEGGWSFFSSDWLARTFYDGGFEDKMSKREAALILGVRESATPERIKDCHRKILLLNHPDRGGSAYMAAKINEAKDVLLKGK